jgi:hypothetical protein
MSVPFDLNIGFDASNKVPCQALMISRTKKSAPQNTIHIWIHSTKGHVFVDRCSKLGISRVCRRPVTIRWAIHHAAGRRRAQLGSCGNVSRVPAEVSLLTQIWRSPRLALANTGKRRTAIGAVLGIMIYICFLGRWRVGKG